MKELSIEEKAKRYDEILARAKGANIPYYKEDIMSKVKEFVDYLVPELKESEDERVRKELLDYLKRFIPHHDTDLVTKSKSWIAWLEKQGEQKPVPKFKIGDTMRTLQEAKDGLTDGMPFVVSIDIEYYNCNSEKIAIKDQDEYEYPPMNRKYDVCDSCDEHKPTDKIEPKFKVGDWITNGINATLQVRSIEDNMYLRSDDYFIDIETADKKFRLWTIQDAKDGDMLSNEEMIVIFKHFEEPSYRQHIVAYIGLDTCGNIQITDGTWILGVNKTKPATKEQRDLLFQKIKEAGYEWDAEKKELKKIE